MQPPPHLCIPPASGIYYPPVPPTLTCPNTLTPCPTYLAYRPKTTPNGPYRPLAIPSEGRDENQARAESPRGIISLPTSRSRRSKHRAGSNHTTIRIEQPSTTTSTLGNPPALPPKPIRYTPRPETDQSSSRTQTQQASEPVPRPSSSTSKMFGGRRVNPLPPRPPPRHPRSPDEDYGYERRPIDASAPGWYVNGGRADSPRPDTEEFEYVYRPHAQRQEREYFRQRVFADSRKPHFGILGSRSRVGDVEDRRSSSPPTQDDEVQVPQRRRHRQIRENDESGPSMSTGRVQGATSAPDPPVPSTRAQSGTSRPTRQSSTSEPAAAPTTRLRPAVPRASVPTQGRSTHLTTPQQRPTRPDPPQSTMRPSVPGATPHREQRPATSTHLRSAPPPPIAPVASRDTQFEDDLEEEMTCPICMSILVGPHQVTPCGHSLCGGCGVQWIQTRASTGDRVNCPTCREPVDQTNPLTPARTLENLIRKWIDNKISTEGEWDGLAEFKEREECWRIHKEYSPEGIIPPSLLRPSAPGIAVVERTPSGTRMPRAEFPIPHVSDMLAHMDSVFNSFHRPNLLPVLEDSSERRERRLPGDLAFRINHWLDEHPGIMDHRFHFSLERPASSGSASGRQSGRPLPRLDSGTQSPDFDHYWRDLFEGIHGDGESDERNPLRRRR
ncbi:hypothetical protein I203_107435 [Kwoniella mangroviensis CBS 8507]|uniref:hypothetical protein n=1 Tax=Kwoniella mangroviensis CBS 8507 TaxID=1296122 RepID=UPI00080CFA62|nr:uncharacterized protein I203_02188 [Kwoniella mangroviensis CBS 8507]OCF68797.1 hypothetical protein I203_02188 [Kwoniella mangroviensis CBS 8507]